MTCAEELEQDEWSLTRPTFETPKGGVLMVVGIIKRPEKYVIIKCPTCEKDPEMFGEGVFRVKRHHISKGGIPCGCGISPRLSSQQAKIKIGRECLKHGDSFLGFCGDYSGSKTKLKLKCKDHGVWSTTNMWSYCTGKRCPMCAGRVQGNTERFIGAAKAIHGEKTYDYRLVDYKKSTEKVEIICTRHGCFSQRPSDHIHGYGCPDCGTERTTSSKKRFVDRCEKANKGQEYDYSLTTYVNRKTKVSVRCLHHGLFEQWPGSLYIGIGCPDCGIRNPYQCYLHQVEDEGTVTAIKVGISKDWERRLSILNRRNLFQSVNIGVWRFPSVKSCRGAEGECKQTLKTGVLSAREMKDGWSETVSVLDLDKVIAIYEKHGGVKIK